jgi:hypothetical protein
MANRDYVRYRTCPASATENLDYKEAPWSLVCRQDTKNTLTRLDSHENPSLLGSGHGEPVVIVMEITEHSKAF